MAVSKRNVPGGKPITRAYSKVADMSDANNPGSPGDSERPEKVRKAIMRIERDMQQGKLYFVLVKGLLFLGLPTVVLYAVGLHFLWGFSWLYNIVLSLLVGVPLSLLLVHSMWEGLPIMLDYLKDVKPTRRAFLRDAKLLLGSGLLLLVLGPVLAWLFGEDARAPDIMSVNAGSILLLWSDLKLTVFWRSQDGWHQRTWRDRYRRLWLAWIAAFFLIVMSWARLVIKPF